MSQAARVFLMPEDEAQLRKRLELRGLEPPDLENRLRNARWEMEWGEKFDHVLVNREGKLHETVALVERVIVGKWERKIERRLPLHRDPRPRPPQSQRRGQSPALALRENGLMKNPLVGRVATRGEYRGRIYAYRHAPTVMRWLNRWGRGEQMKPLRLTER